MDFGKEYFEFSKNEQGFDMRCCGKCQEDFARMIIDVFDLKEGVDILMLVLRWARCPKGSIETMYLFWCYVSQWYVIMPISETQTVCYY